MSQIGIDIGTISTQALRWHDGGWTTEQVPPRGARFARVIAALPAADSFLRVVVLPEIASHDVAAAVRWEMQRVLPYPVDKAVLDYIPLDPGRSSEVRQLHTRRQSPEGVQRRYAVTGATISAVDSRMQHLRQRGIRVKSLESEWITLWRLALVAAQRTAVACGVVDLGASGTRLLIVDSEGVPVVAHEVRTGVAALVEEIARRLQITEEQAKTASLGELADDLGVLNDSPALASLVGEISRAVRHASRRTEGDGFELYAIGGGACWLGLRRTVEQAIGVSATLPGDGAGWLSGLSPATAIAGFLALYGESLDNVDASLPQVAAPVVREGDHFAI